MSGPTHLKSLQALEMALRTGSLKAAAARLGITPAALGQRIRALEDYLELDLLVRGRSGLQATPELEQAIADLRAGFAALERACDTLDLQRRREIHIVADPDWSELWLAPRLPEFRTAHPYTLFCINGSGEVPLRPGAPDIRIEHGTETGEALYTDRLLPVTGPDNPRRIADGDPVMQMEGMPLLHLEAHRQPETFPGWVAWFAAFGHRTHGPDRGVYYRHARTALEAVRQNVGFLMCGLSLVLDDLERGDIVLPFPAHQHLVAPAGYRMRLRSGAEAQPHIMRFAGWLRAAAHATATRLEELTRPSGA